MTDAYQYYTLFWGDTTDNVSSINLFAETKNQITTHMYNIQVDFQNDFNEILAAELAEYGFTINATENSDNIRAMFFNFKRRLINPNPRNVLFSNIFSCPQELQTSLDILTEKIKNGNDLTPYLSKNINKLRYNDTLLNDWKIKHLHLGQNLESNNKFIERTGPVLFARFDSENAYFINVLTHGSWTKQDMVKTIHLNWPDSIKSYLLNGVVSLNHVPTDEDVKAYRKYGVNSAIEVAPQVIYAPIGGGLTSAKTSIEVTLVMNDYYRKLQNLEKYVQDNLQEIGDEIFKKTGQKNHLLNMKLAIEDNNYFAVEQSSKITVNLGKH